jgi:hypothetical protein
MPETTATAKICVHCDQDCSAKPRTKDGQGRYLCRECLDKLKTKAAAPPAPAAPPRPKAPPAPRPAVVAAPPVAEEGSVLSTLLADSPAPCPGCAAPMGKDTIICAFCGFNKQTGEAARTRIARAPKEKKERSGPHLSLSPAALFFITAGVQIAPLALLLVNKDLAIVFQLLGAACSLAVVVWTIIDGFMTSPASGALLIVTLFIPLLNVIYWLYYIFSVCENVYLRAVWLAQVLVTIATFVLVFAGAMALASGA